MRRCSNPDSHANTNTYADPNSDSNTYAYTDTDANSDACAAAGRSYKSGRKCGVFESDQSVVDG